MTDLMTIGYTGLRTYQTALGTTSENIANAATPGYARRTATVREFGRTNAVQVGQAANLSGSGSFVDGIARASDAFRIAEVRTTGSDLARTQTGVVWLDRIETSLTGNQLGQRLTAFFNAAKGVAADPAASAPRAVMLENAASLASAFAGTGRALDAAAADLAETGADAAQSLSDLAASLARVNTGLLRSDPGSANQAQLLDERDRLLDGMSALVDVDVAIDGFGRATVRAGGGGGPTLVDSAGAGYVTFATNASGAVAFTMHRNGAAQAIPANGGAVAGLVDGAVKIAGARETLDDVAARFVAGVNALQAGGRDLDNAPGAAMFAVGAKPTDITLALSDPRGIAAAAVGEGVRGNGTMAAVATLRTAGGFEAGLDDLVTGNAAALSARQNVATAQGSIHDSAVFARDAVSGVDLDEEAVNLIRFQQAYQASSRVIQVARDILQSIIDIR